MALNLTRYRQFLESGMNPAGASALSQVQAAGTAVTPAASPWTYTAPAYNTFLTVTGGTVSAITIAGVAAPTSGILPLEAGDAVVVTYSAAPTVTSRLR